MEEVKKPSFDVTPYDSIKVKASERAKLNIGLINLHRISGQKLFGFVLQNIFSVYSILIKNTVSGKLGIT